MKIEHYPEEKLKKEIIDILSKYLDLNDYKVFFFGSRTRDFVDERADIDIGIEGPEIPPDIFLQIQEEIENIPTLYKIDFVDFNKVDDFFKKIAKEKIEEII